MSNIAVLCDEQGNVLGHKDRYKLAPGDMILIASLWLVNSRGQVLIAQRSHHKHHDPNKWGAAAAGTMEPGETAETNIIKEAEEEIGLKNLKPIPLHHSAHWREDDGTGRYNTVFYARSDQPAEAFVLQEDEVAAVRWIEPELLLQEVRQHPEQFTGTLERWTYMLALIGNIEL